MIGESWEYKLPDALHKDGLAVKFKIDLSSCDDFVLFDDVQTLSIGAGTTKSSDIGTYFITITLVDEIGIESQKYFYSVLLFDEITYDSTVEDIDSEIVNEDDVVLSPTVLKTNDAVREANEASTQLREKF